MQHTPPCPLFTSETVEAIRTSKPVDEQTATARFAGMHLTTVVGASAGQAVWALLPEKDVPPYANRLLSRVAFEAIRDGEVDGDTVLWKGQKWRLADLGMLAVLVSAETGTT